MVLFLVQGCTGGDGPPPPPPRSLVAILGAEEIQVEPIAPGVAYYRFIDEDQPWAVHVLRVDLSRCELGLSVLEAPVSSGSRAGRARVTELVGSAGEGFLAAVNGDFFTPEGRPLGTEVVGGDVRQIRIRPTLAWSPGRSPWIGVPQVQGDSGLVVGWTVSSSRGDGETQALGGCPLLLTGGGRVSDLEVDERPSFAAERHPRTAVGFDADGRILWLIVVDGRQPGYSAGMTLPELADLMEALQVEDAVNLDGGGSTVLVVEGSIVSRPSDPEGERPVVNALGVVKDPGFCGVGR